MMKDMELILIKKNDRWINVINNHTNYGLDNALRELYQELDVRRFIIEDDKVYRKRRNNENNKK